MKRNTLNILGISARSYKHIASTRLYRYSTIFSDHEYSHFLDIVWSEKPDPKNPDSGWGSSISINAFPLLGENVEIVPENSIGYKMDRTCDASTWSNNAYSYTDISSLFHGGTITSNNEFFYASVYCYVSKDFDGTWVHISAEGGASGKIVQEYDFNKNGVWQKLSICFKNMGNISPVYLYWAKNGVNDFSNLKGHIIFAYPEYRIVKADPKDPSIGWGSRISTPVFTLFGGNVEIVPENSIGYKMDRTCDASTWSNNAYSYTDISSLFHGGTTTADNEFFYASVYCYVSKDFDGTWVHISAENGASGKIVQEYDFSKKGTWQKLQIDFAAKSGIPPVYLYWSKYGVTDFSSLKGCVIFAYPQYEIVSKNDSVSSFLNAPIKNKTKDFITNKITEFNKNHLSNNTINHLDGINKLNEGGYDFNGECIPIYQQKLIASSSNTYQYRAGFFTSSIPLLTTLLSTGIDKDPIRKWAAKLISEDTTYYGYKNELFVDTISNKFIGERLMRWQFAWQIYIKEYNWKQKIFGGGFNFLNWFGYRFLKDKTFSDYPHNPFLSILLYSGIFGLIIYLVLFYKAIYYYIKYLREYPILSVFFLITFFFSFFSAGSPFDPPVMGFFVILPFFIHHVHKNQEQVKSIQNNK